MTNEEHLIENALMHLEKDKTYDDYCEDKTNVSLMYLTGINLRQVWDMAQYVMYSYIPEYNMRKEKVSE